MLYQTENQHGGDIYTEKILYDFSSNINPLGTPSYVLDAVRNSIEEINHYPDPFCRKAAAAVSRYEQIPEQLILMGNGAAELIYAFCGTVKPRSALIITPAFSEYKAALALNKCKICHHNLLAENNFTLTASILKDIDKYRPDAVFLTNPNNPTGRLCDKDLLSEILETCEKKGKYLFADQCFLEFTDTEDVLKDHLSDHPHLFIIKAFTKSYALAGLRIGYALNSDPKLLHQISLSSQPWNISIPAQAAAAAIRKEDGFMERTRQLIREEQRHMTESLKNLGLQVCPSDANFILFHGPAGLDRLLQKKQIAVRNCSNFSGLSEGWYRTAIRTHEENEILIKAIRQILPEASLWQKTS